VLCLQAPGGFSMHFVDEPLDPIFPPNPKH
jgi:hypothetical protein